MNIDEIIVDYAKVEVEDFVNWVKQSNSKLAEDILGKDTFYKTSDVEKLFEALESDKKKDYQFLVDNEHNFAVARHLGLLEPSLSMPTGEPGHLLKKSIKILESASVEKLDNPVIINLGTRDVENIIPPSDAIFSKGGTDFQAVLNNVMKDQALKNIDNLRTVFYFTDGEPTKDPKPKQ
jgi:hypothetical protein